MMVAAPGYWLATTAAPPAISASVASAYAWTIGTAISLGILKGTKESYDDYKNYKNKKKEKKDMELNREIFEIESMGIEDTYSFDLRVYKNRPLKIKNIQQYMKDSKAKITKKIKKRVFSILKGTCKMLKSFQFKGTGDLLSNWSFETHNHVDHINLYTHINPSLIGFNPNINTSNPQNK